jgi:hypothetical protein
MGWRSLREPLILYPLVSSSDIKIVLLCNILHKHYF